MPGPRVMRVPRTYPSADGQRLRIRCSRGSAVGGESILYRVDAYSPEDQWLDGLQAIYGGAGVPRVDEEAYGLLWRSLKKRLEHAGHGPASLPGTPARQQASRRATSGLGVEQSPGFTVLRP